MSEEIDVANLGMLRELLGDKFTELVDTFIADSEERISAIRESLLTYDVERIRHEAHGLKGSCRNIGANPMGDLCQTMEYQSRDEELRGGEQQLAAIEQKFAAVASVLKAYI